MNLLTINKEIIDGAISITITFNYELITLDFGLEATSNLVNAFNISLTESLEKTLDHKYQEDSYASVINGNVKFISKNIEFIGIIFGLVGSINENSNNIITQIKNEDLLLQDEQQEFFNKVLSYELLHILLKIETEKVKGGDTQDKKPPKV